MSLLRRAVTLPIPEDRPSSAVLYQQRQGAGGSATVDTALKTSSVWSCVRLKGDAVAASPVGVFRRDGMVRTPVDAPLVISDPQPGLTQHDWMFSAVASLELTGNTFAFKAGLDRLGYPTSLPLLAPQEVEVVEKNGHFLGYKVNGEPVPADRIWHVRGFTMPGRWRGISPLAMFAQTFGLAAEAERFGYQFFIDGAIPSAIIYSDERLTSKQARGLKETIVEAWRGKREPAVLGSGLKYEKVSTPPNESQFLESQQFSIEQICRVFMVPPEMIGHSSGGSSITYANVEQRQLAFQTWTLLPLSSRIEAALDDVLPPGTFARLNLDSLVRVDLLTRYRAHSMAIRDEWATRNERRTLEDLAPLPGLDAPGLGRAAGAAGAAGASAPAPSDADQARAAAELIQKIYLGVGVVLTAEEARAIANRAGAELSGPLPSGAPA